MIHTFTCPEIAEYDRQINEESHAKLQGWIEKYSPIQVGEVVTSGIDKRRYLVLEVLLMGEEGLYHFHFVGAPINVKGAPIKNRKKMLLDYVIKENGFRYMPPSFAVKLYSPAQMRHDDYFYVHKRYDHGF